MNRVGTLTSAFRQLHILLPLLRYVMSPSIITYHALNVYVFSDRDPDSGSRHARGPS